MHAVGERPDPLKQTDDRFSQGPVRFEVEFGVRSGREGVVRRAWEGAERDLGVLLGGVEMLNGKGGGVGGGVTA